MLDFKDEILEGNPKYRVRDENGNIIVDNASIEMITNIMQEGTLINKKLFDNIQEEINVVGTFKQEDYLNFYSGPTSNDWDTWENMPKGEEIKIQLSNKRYFIIEGIGLGLNYSSPVSRDFVLLFDTYLNKRISLSVEQSQAVDGHTLFGLEQMGSSGPLFGVVFDFNEETRELTYIPAVYSNSIYNVDATWEAKVCVTELLSEV